MRYCAAVAKRSPVLAMAAYTSGCRIRSRNPSTTSMTPGVMINAVIHKKFALVVPTLNEAENIVIVLDRVREALSPLPLVWEILVVDDDSTDGTAETVRRYAKTHAMVHLLERQSQKGLAGAITYGWKHTDADIIGAMDADLQHPPELLPELV